MSVKWFDADKTIPTGRHPFRNVLIANPQGSVGIGVYSGVVGRVVPLYANTFQGPVTHWAELPEPPPKPERVYRVGEKLTLPNGRIVTLLAVGDRYITGTLDGVSNWWALWINRGNPAARWVSYSVALEAVDHRDYRAEDFQLPT